MYVYIFCTYIYNYICLYTFAAYGEFLLVLNYISNIAVSKLPNHADLRGVILLKMFLAISLHMRHRFGFQRRKTCNLIEQGQTINRKT